MQINRMKQHLEDSRNVEGDIVEFGVYQGTTFSHLVAFAASTDKTAYGIDSFQGLPPPIPKDRNSNNTLPHAKGKYKATLKEVTDKLTAFPEESYNVLAGWIPEVLGELPDVSYSFALVDLINYTPTRQALEYVWDRMSYGGTLYFDNFISHENFGCTAAIKEFMEDHKDEMLASRQMMINGIREKELAIKCLRKARRPRNWNDDQLIKRPISIALVLRTGGIYTHKYVNNLVDGIKSNLSVPHRLVCITDDKRGLSSDIDDVIRFKHNWPKWWGKIELFRPGLFTGEQVFYFDLDTFVVGNIDNVVKYDGEFCALRDFYHLSSMGSGLMSWHGDRVLRIYDEFKQNPNHYMQKYLSGGDQDFISYYKPSLEYFQDAFPGEVVSYKVHCQDALPQNAKVVCFHGNPRPHEITNNLGKYWKQ